MSSEEKAAEQQGEERAGCDAHEEKELEKEHHAVISNVPCAKWERLSSALFPEQ